MQTINNNSVQYLVFPYEEFTYVGDGTSYVILMTPTLTNNQIYTTFATASLEEQNSRWRVMESLFTDNPTTDLGKLYVKSGLTYEVDLRFGVSPYYIWGEAYPEWIEAKGTWAQGGLNKEMIEANTILLNQDRAFISGSVDPTRKLYITSNEDASFVIYQG